MTRFDDFEGEKISPDDTKSLQFYWRITAQENLPTPGKGVKTYELVTYSLRLVGIGYRPPVTSEKTWNNPDIAQAIMKILGESPYLSGKEYLNVSGQAVTDKLTVIQEEYQNNERMKKDVLRMIAFAINCTLKQRVTGVLC